jgi:hypothetical protein
MEGIEGSGMHTAVDAFQAPDWGHLPAVAVQVSCWSMQELLLLKLLLVLLRPRGQPASHCQLTHTAVLLIPTFYTFEPVICRLWASGAVLQAVQSCAKCAAAGTTHWPRSLLTYTLGPVAHGQAVRLPWTKMMMQLQQQQLSSV